MATVCVESARVPLVGYPCYRQLIRANLSFSEIDVTDVTLSSLNSPMQCSSNICLMYCTCDWLCSISFYITCVLWCTFLSKISIWEKPGVNLQIKHPIVGSMALQIFYFYTIFIMNLVKCQNKPHSDLTNKSCKKQTQNPTQQTPRFVITTMCLWFVGWMGLNMSWEREKNWKICKLYISVFKIAHWIFALQMCLGFYFVLV